MADKRAYFKLDVGYLSNPKVVGLLEEQPRAIILHLECIAYGAQHLTDGVVPVRTAMRLACAEQCDLDACLNAGLLKRVNDTHVRVHDYLEHQRSADSVKGASEQAKRAAEARWNGSDEAADGNAVSIPNSNAYREEKKERGSDADASTDPNVIKLCDHLASRIEANGSKRPAVTKRWHVAARLLLERDGRTLEQALWLVDWCQEDHFWRSNVLSMPKFRDKFDQMRLQADRGNVRSLPQRTDDQGRLVLPPLPKGVFDQ
jgi:hypothetical protein